MFTETWVTLHLAGSMASGGVSAGLSGLAAWARRRYPGQRHPDETFYVRTPDGWNLQVIRYLPSGPHRPWAEPIVLCHGLAANSWSVDLDDRSSLARYLAARGFDVFVPDLRGSDGSWPVDPRKRNDYTFDDHANFDAPVILQAALERSGAAHAFWVGHSMGGMIGYVLASRDNGLAGLVTLASPVEFHADQLLTRLVRLALRVPIDPLPQRRMAMGLAPIITPTFPPIPELSALRYHLELDTLRLALTNAITDMPHRILRQFAGWGLLERMGDADGGGDYRNALPKVKVPLLVVAANADRLAPPSAVQPGFVQAGSDDRTWICLGESPDGPSECGHADIVLGRYAPTQVFPRIAGWLEERATAGPRRILPARRLDVERLRREQMAPRSLRREDPSVRRTLRRTAEARRVLEERTRLLIAEALERPPEDDERLIRPTPTRCAVGQGGGTLRDGNGS